MKLHTNTDMVIKNVKCGIKYKDFEHCHKYTNVKNNLTEYKYLCCNKNYQKRSMKFEGKDLLTHTIFLIMISKSFFCRCKSGLPVWIYGWLRNWEKIDEKTLPEKEDLYNRLNIEFITDADYTHAKRVCQDIEIKNLGEYHDFHVQSDTLLLADILENFQNMSLEIYELDPALFTSAPGLAWKAALKNTTVKLDLSTDVDMSLMVEKGIRGGLFHAIHQYEEANNKYIKNYDENNE